MGGLGGSSGDGSSILCDKTMRSNSIGSSTTGTTTTNPQLSSLLLRQSLNNTNQLYHPNLDMGNGNGMSTTATTTVGGSNFTSLC